MIKLKSIEKSIFWLYSYVFISGLYFDRALWVLYLAERGMNMSQVGFLESFLHLFIVFFEVPTGIIADLYGRKISLIIGHFISLFYALFMFIGGHFYIFTLAFALLGLSFTFKSGADQALLYDVLLKLKKEDKFTKILGNQTAIVLISLSIAKLIGGFVAELNWGLVYLLIIFVQVFGFIPLGFVREPKLEKANKKEEINIKEYSPIRAWKSQLKDGFSVWKNKPEIRIPTTLYLMLLSVIVVIIFYAQEYYARLGYSESSMGIIFTIESILGVAAAKLAYRFENKWSSTKIIKVSYYLFILFFLIFSYYQNVLTVLSLFVIGMLTEFIDPIFSNFIQIRIDSKVRATVFSMISLVNSLAIMIMFPLFGLLIDIIGFQLSFFLFIILLIIVLLTQSKIKASKL